MIDLSDAVWRKSRRTQAQGQCVEVAHVGDAVAVRDSKDPHGPVLVFTVAQFTAFVQGVTDGGLAHRR